MLCIIKFLLLLSLIKHEDHSISAHQTLSRRVSRPFFIGASNISAASLLIQAHSISSASASRSIIKNHTHSIAGVTTALPIPFYPIPGNSGDQKTTKTNQDIKSGTCAIEDDYCSSKKDNGRVGTVNATNIDDACLLWDPSCSGNRTLARDTFFGPTFQHDLLNNTCFVQAGSVNLVNASNCNKYNPPGRMSEFQEMKNWMRSQQCVSAATEWATNEDIVEDPSSEEGIQMDPYHYHIESGAIPSCCGACEMNVENVDIYYWPEPDANTSCLDIVGDSVRPLGYGATTTEWTFGTETSTDTYWGCDAKTSTTYDTFLRESVTNTEATTTAMIRTIGSLLVKVSLSDPWSSSPCTETDVMSQGTNGSAETSGKRATMHARGHTLIIPSSVSHKDNTSVTTMVSGKFTL